MGFINFWLYDEEIFSFEDGKLLLRGQNGSGKSITTQSFIPFILDGDRTPSRLDPFGSGDRKMDYYFLGEEGKEESTGYLFLEFKKEDTEQYRTVAIGQRARRGKPMTFWGFVLLDGRRIGYDIWLYKEVGSTKIPYDKGEMKKLLGEQTPFTDVPGEYKKLVNRYLFGFRRIDQYDQFIRLLVKVRAPKLSKEFKPTKVYEILNESLQTLTDEDLRAMVDAMEKMDSIQGNLEQLNSAFSDIRVIRNEYTRYNQFMLARKAQAYLNCKKEVENIRGRFDAQEQQYQDFRQEQSEKQKVCEQLKQRGREVEIELEGIHETDLESVQDSLSRNRKEQAEATELAGKWAQDIERGRERIRECDGTIHKLGGEIEALEGKIEKDAQELEEIQQIVLWNGHKEMLGLLRQCAEETEYIQEKWKSLKKAVSDGTEALKTLAEATKEYDLAAERLERTKADRDRRADELEDALTEEEQCRDELIESYYRMAKQCRELKLSTENLQTLEKMVTEYRGRQDAGPIQRLLDENYRTLEKELQERKQQQKQERLECEGSLSVKREELEQLRSKQEIEPARSALKEEARRKLTELGVCFTPFFKAVEFAPQLTEEQCDILEAQLKDAGVLDALVVVQKDRVRLQKELPELADIVISVEGEEKQEYSKLTVNSEMEEELQKETHRILRHICEKKEGSVFYLGEAGGFQNGILLGNSMAEERAQFVGRLARQRRREKMIADLSEEIRQLELLLEEIMKQEAQTDERFLILKQEYKEVPVFDGLESCIEKLKQCRWYLEQTENQYKEEERETKNKANCKNDCYQRMLQICKRLPYERTIKAYMEVQDNLEEYGDIRGSMRDKGRLLVQYRSQRQNEQDKINREEENIDRAYEQKKRELNRVKSLEVSIRQAEEFLNDPQNKERAEKLEKLKKRQNDIRDESGKLENRLYWLEEKLLEMKGEKEGLENRLTSVISEETYLRKYFEEELSLGLVLSRETKTVEECAREALGVLRDSDKGRNPEDLTTSLLKVFQQHNSSLVNYGTTLEDCFDEEPEIEAVTRRRQRIFSVWNGKKLYLEEFYNTVKETIEETELLIQEKDREIFEDILSKTLSQQLTDRISESRSWVEDMSKLMKQMDTSMGLHFALDWKPKTAENDQELDTTELEKLLLRDKELLTIEDVEKMALHFRSKIREEKRKAEESGGMVNYMDLVRDALDYRRWFEFQMSYTRSGENRKLLTNAAFNRFSGGEKAMAMYVPLFAAVNAQYQKAEEKDCPRIVAMDEAFAGVDDKNISTMFELVERLKFDYIMNSQALWGCYQTVPALRISELLHPVNSQTITVIHYTWNGHERKLDEQ
ncbi:MAG: TIGR02680 family protein [bacterium]|nr:TIGR02680 family protein [bacterium]